LTLTIKVYCKPSPLENEKIYYIFHYTHKSVVEIKKKIGGARRKYEGEERIYVIYFNQISRSTTILTL